MSIKKDIVDWIKDYTKNKFSLVVGVSGGIDSAVVSTLCAETGIKTFVVTLPINQEINQLNNAKKHIEWLTSKYKNVESFEIDLTNLFNILKNSFNFTQNDLSLANAKSRLRMVALYHVSSNFNGIVVGTGNKIEDFGIGFFTKYGDGGVDISPIADLYKSEVYNLAKELSIINDIQSAKPTDGLWDDNRNDESQIGATYDEMEWAMTNLNNTNLENLTHRQIEVLKIYKNFNEKNKHKMIGIPIFKKNNI